MSAKRSRGLPIAAHLALLVALVFATAFAVTLTIILALPPRPPDVMRSDQIVSDFVTGYRAAAETGRAPRSTRMRWAVRTGPPPVASLSAAAPVKAEIAQRLNLPPDKVALTGDFVRRDTLVFRVQRGHAEHIRQMEVHVATHITREKTAGAPDAPTPPAPPSPPVVVGAPPEPPVVFAPAPPNVTLLSGFTLAAELPNGRWLVMRQGRNDEEWGWILRAALIVGATLLALTALALWFARRLARPIQTFAAAVQAVGVDPKSGAVAEEGPRELRNAAGAVNAMAARLRALVADRTQTLATVAHDMRTPLMRLRLAAERSPPDQRERIAKEIAEMEALIASFIAFARDDPTSEKRVRLDLVALLQSVADDQAEAGRDVRLSSAESRLVIVGQPLGLKRLFTNLIDNAVKYGARADVALRRDGAEAVIDILDGGPGVPAGKREEVFKPFVRLHEHHGDGVSGAGLGLTAARSIARAHGGDVTIEETQQGGLVRVRLPIEEPIPAAR
ncbi:MAG: HAMP domain-containing protein [Hydrogenophilaceae bacterium]|jgi:signal transduction histidine kinase|nr:HAMP domain-containing protein [Hydrogenophilaceae bacterium]